MYLDNVGFYLLRDIKALKILKDVHIIAITEKISKSWFTIGEITGIPKEFLLKLKQEESKDESTKCNEMLKEFLKREYRCDKLLIGISVFEGDIVQACVLDIIYEAILDILNNTGKKD